MKRITGRLEFEVDEAPEAMVAVADFTGRMRALGWDVDGIEVVIKVPKPESH